MSVAVLNDIHGNLPALEAVLAEMRRERVERVIVGGDVVPGPMTRESMAALAALDVPVEYLHGNGETAVREALAGRDHPAVPEVYRPLLRWTARHLAADYGAWLTNLPATLHLSIAGIGDVVFCHGTPRDDNEIFTRLTPDEVIRPMFDGVNVARAALVVCGHTHMPFDRRLGAVRIVNSGSVGMPFGAPGADWLLLGPGVTFRHTDYDRDAAAARIRATEYPDAESFAAQYVLNPPTESRMLEAFTAASMARRP